MLTRPSDRSGVFRLFRPLLSSLSILACLRGKLQIIPRTLTVGHHYGVAHARPRALTTDAKTRVRAHVQRAAAGGSRGISLGKIGESVNAFLHSLVTKR